jgi:SAM-dependent methyltransferase
MAIRRPSHTNEKNVNINTQVFWDSRFAGGYWENLGGRTQTRDFAEAQSKYIALPKKFAGTLLDFGCGLGDAIPVYRKYFPAARLVGVDFSEAAIDKCRESYGSIAQFVCGDHQGCPEADVIVTSNVLEHLENDQEVASILLSKSKELYIVVPYREQYLIDEHLRAYDKHSFDALSPVRVKAFASRGWSQYGIRSRWWEFHTKNLLRPCLGKPLLRRRMQVMFHFHNKTNQG